MQEEMQAVMETLQEGGIPKIAIVLTHGSQHQGWEEVVDRLPGRAACSALA